MQYLEQCASNLQIMGSVPTHTCVWKMFFLAVASALFTLSHQEYWPLNNNFKLVLEKTDKICCLSIIRSLQENIL